MLPFCGSGRCRQRREPGRREGTPFEAYLRDGSQTATSGLTNTQDGALTASLAGTSQSRSAGGGSFPSVQRQGGAEEEGEEVGDRPEELLGDANLAPPRPRRSSAGSPAPKPPLLAAADLKNCYERQTHAEVEELLDEVFDEDPGPPGRAAATRRISYPLLLRADPDTLCVRAFARRGPLVQSGDDGGPLARSGAEDRIPGGVCLADEPPFAAAGQGSVAAKKPLKLVVPMTQKFTVRQAAAKQRLRQCLRFHAVALASRGQSLRANGKGLPQGFAASPLLCALALARRRRRRLVQLRVEAAAAGSAGGTAPASVVDAAAAGVAVDMLWKSRIAFRLEFALNRVILSP